MADRRAQSNPLATVILLGIVLATASTIVLFGGGVIDTLSTSADTERATQEMSHLAAESAAVGLGGSQQRRVTFDASEGKLTLNETASWICVQNGTTDAREFILPEDGDPSASCGENRTYMGTMTYDTGDGRVAYEGGGVWTRGDDGESRMVSPPEFHYRGDTLTLPVVVLDGNVTRAGSETELTARDGETDQVDGISNPLDDSSGRVYVTIRSEYYEAWGDFLAERTDGQVVELDDDAKTVTVELVVPSPVTVQNAIYSKGNDGNAVQVQNMDIDSYDSDTYSSSTAKESGDVVTDGGANPIKGTVDGDVYTVRKGAKAKIAGTGRVNGSVHSQKKVDIVDSGVVEEDVFTDEKVTVRGNEVGGSIHADKKVELRSSGVSVGNEVRTGSKLMFESDSVTVDGDIHAEDIKNLDKDPTLNGDVYTNDTYGQGSGTGVPVSGELHARDGIYTDDTKVDGSAYTDSDLEDTDSEYGGEVHAGGDADLSGTTVSKTVYVAGDAELDSVTINDEIHIGGDLTCSGSNSVSGGVYVDGTVTQQNGCSLSSGGSASLGPLTSPDDPKPPTSPDEPTPDPPKIELPPEDEFDSVPASCTNGGGTIQVQSSDHCELPPGTYNVSKLDVDQGKLTFEKGGRVELYVSDDLSLSSGNITTAPAGEHDATRVEVNYYGNQEASVLANFTGVINAPNVKVDMDEGNYKPHVHGAIIAKKVQGDNGVQVHYDEDLSGRTVGDGQNGTTSIQYLHVTTNEVELEDD
jgi:cytoskeletal protein CcmA (bactofilin family)